MAERNRIRAMQKAMLKAAPKDAAGNAVLTDTEKAQYEVWENWQAAIKISTNAIYGACGAATGSLYCLPVASSTTFLGRNFIKATTVFVDTPGAFSQLGFGEVKAKNVYSDTDSLFIRTQFADPTPARALDLMDAMVKRVNTCGIITEPMKIGGEGAYLNLLLMSAKIYTAKKYARGKTPEKIEKGTVGRRRDNAPWISSTYSEMIEMINAIVPGNRTAQLDAVEAFVGGRIAELLGGLVPIEQLTITMKLSKDLDVRCVLSGEVQFTNGARSCGPR